jgi:hypothetical protein
MHVLCANKEKVDTSDKEMVPVCVFNFAPLNISFKDVQKCADFIKVEVGDISGTWIIGSTSD